MREKGDYTYGRSDGGESENAGKKKSYTHTPSSPSVGETQGSAEPTYPTDGGIGSLSEAMRADGLRVDFILTYLSLCIRTNATESKG